MIKDIETEIATQDTPTPPIELPAVAPADLLVSFSEVSVKHDGTFVVTVADNRCHVTRDYNESLYKAICAYLNSGGDSTEYAEDIVVEADPVVLARQWVETSLQTSESIVAQYRDARDLGEETPITPEQFAGLLTWRKAVREWPKEKGYPLVSSQPNAPDWLKEVLQNDE